MQFIDKFLKCEGLPGFNGSKNCKIFVGLCHPPQELPSVFGINRISSPFTSGIGRDT